MTDYATALDKVDHVVPISKHSFLVECVQAVVIIPFQ